MTINETIANIVALIGGGAGFGALLQYLSNKQSAKRIDFEMIKNLLLTQIESEKKEQARLEEKIEEGHKKIESLLEQLDKVKDDKEKLLSLLHSFSDALDFIPLPIVLRKGGGSGDLVIVNLNSTYEKQFLFQIHKRKTDCFNKTIQDVFEVADTAVDIKKDTLIIQEYESQIFASFIFLKFNLFDALDNVIGVGEIGIEKTEELKYIIKNK